MIERTYRCQPHRRKQEQRDVVDRQTDRSRWGRQAPNRRAAPAAPKSMKAMKAAVKSKVAAFAGAKRLVKMPKAPDIINTEELRM